MFARNICLDLLSEENDQIFDSPFLAPLFSQAHTLKEE
jgi:hypothetical protein